MSAKIDERIALSRAKEAAIAEQKRRAECYDDLLAALDAAMDWNWLDDDARPSRTADICDAAIAKATGNV